MARLGVASVEGRNTRPIGKEGGSGVKQEKKVIPPKRRKNGSYSIRGKKGCIQRTYLD